MNRKAKGTRNEHRSIQLLESAGYPKSGPHQGPAQVLQHYVATARGAKLLDEKTLDYMGRLSKELAAEKGEHRRTYFRTMVSPFLKGLKPGPRQK